MTQERGREGKMKVVHLPASAKGSEARARERGIVFKREWRDPPQQGAAANSDIKRF